MSRKISFACWKIRAASASASATEEDVEVVDDVALDEGVDATDVDVVCDDIVDCEEDDDDGIDNGDNGTRCMNILLLQSQIIAFSILCRVSRTKFTA
jgi:hypothetical protein